MNLILCGMMGCGKTTVGKLLASDRTWLDTDTLIEEKHGKISDIFAKHGEAHFRALERALVRELCERDGLVLSTGGGLVLDSENVKLLKKKGLIVFLQAEKQTLFARLQADTSRPLLQAGSLSQRLDELLATRTPLYLQAADVVVNVDKKSPQEIAEEIIKKEGKWAGTR